MSSSELIRLKNPNNNNCLTADSFQPGACTNPNAKFARLNYGNDGLVFGLTDTTKSTCVKLSPDGTYTMDSLTNPKIYQPCIPFSAADVYTGVMGYKFLYA